MSRSCLGHPRPQKTMRGFAAPIDSMIAAVASVECSKPSGGQWAPATRSPGMSACSLCPAFAATPGAAPRRKMGRPAQAAAVLSHQMKEAPGMRSGRAFRCSLLAHTNGAPSASRRLAFSTTWRRPWSSSTCRRMSTLGVTTEPPCPRAHAVRMCSIASSLVSRSIGSPIRVQRSEELSCPDLSVVSRTDAIVSLTSLASGRDRSGALDPAEGRALEGASWRCAVLAG